MLQRKTHLIEGLVSVEKRNELYYFRDQYGWKILLTEDKMNRLLFDSLDVMYTVLSSSNVSKDKLIKLSQILNHESSKYKFDVISDFMISVVKKNQSGFLDYIPYMFTVLKESCSEIYNERSGSVTKIVVDRLLSIGRIDIALEVSIRLGIKVIFYDLVRNSLKSNPDYRRIVDNVNSFVLINYYIKKLSMSYVVEFRSKSNNANMGNASFFYSKLRLIEFLDKPKMESSAELIEFCDLFASLIINSKSIDDIEFASNILVKLSSLKTNHIIMKSLISEIRLEYKDKRLFVFRFYMALNVNPFRILKFSNDNQFNSQSESKANLVIELARNHEKYIPYFAVGELSNHFLETILSLEERDIIKCIQISSLNNLIRKLLRTQLSNTNIEESIKVFIQIKNFDSFKDLKKYFENDFKQDSVKQRKLLALIKTEKIRKEDVNELLISYTNLLEKKSVYYSQIKKQFYDAYSEKDIVLIKNRLFKQSNQYFYHVTHIENVQSILKNGLVPKYMHNDLLIFSHDRSTSTINKNEYVGLYLGFDGIDGFIRNRFLESHDFDLEYAVLEINKSILLQFSELALCESLCSFVSDSNIVKSIRDNLTRFNGNESSSILLFPFKIPNAFICTIFVSSDRTKDKLVRNLSSPDGILAKIVYQSNMFRSIENERRIHDLCVDLESVLSDYRVSKIDRYRVKRWVDQFPKEYRLIILEELSHIFRTNYYSHFKAREALKIFFSDRNIFGTSPSTCLMNTIFLSDQKYGTSQQDMRELSEDVIYDLYKIRIGDCTSTDVKLYIYIDDGLYSGNRTRIEIQNYVEKNELQNVRFICFHICDYLEGRDYVQNELMGYMAYRNIDFKIYSSHSFENRRNSLNLDVIYPDRENEELFDRQYINSLEIEAKTKKYRFERLFRDFELNDESLFTSIDRRKVVESLFLDFGYRIMKQSVNYPNLRPLGFHKFCTLGFGSMFFFYRNISNNSPLVFWYGGDNIVPKNDWFPLFERRMQGSEPWFKYRNE